MDKPRCPCCAFDLNLFLPSTIPKKEGEEDDNFNSIQQNSHDDDDDQPISPKQAFQEIQDYASSLQDKGTIDDSSTTNQVFLLVDTHGHAQLDRPRDETYDVGTKKNHHHDNNDLKISPTIGIGLKSLTCAVEPSDWEATIQFASQSPEILPALGVHPWYLADLNDTWLEDLERLLLQHPAAIVGEIGLCKMARFVRQHPDGKAVALGIQRSVFKDQMLLAAKLRRPVSVHCVNQHGVFLEVLEEILSTTADNQGGHHLQKFPTAIAMHSFTGTAHQINEILKFENRLSPLKPMFYFGFSHTVNHVMCTSEKARRKGKEAVKAVPSDRLLAESDVHSPADLCGGTAGAISYIAWSRGETIVDIATTTSKNGRSFLEVIAAGTKL
jgi:Tat protein secretion system quality control protein TatD with DNase activity